MFLPSFLQEEEEEEKVSDYLSFRLSTVADIESATGINFFTDLSPEEQAALELHITTNLWT